MLFYSDWSRHFVWNTLPSRQFTTLQQDDEHAHVFHMALPAPQDQGSPLFS